EAVIQVGVHLLQRYSNSSKRTASPPLNSGVWYQVKRCGQPNDQSPFMAAAIAARCGSSSGLALPSLILRHGRATALFAKSTAQLTFPIRLVSYGFLSRNPRRYDRVGKGRRRR